VFNGVPSINTRAVQTKVLVDNGQTVVLGGVHEETNQNDVDKVPILGDLPIVGNLFKRTRQNTDKRELLIFVTPKILE
ncbi:MAG: type IV pilus secretin PilQ, partial [Thiotrichaceae bacterium]